MVDPLRRKKLSLFARLPDGTSGTSYRVEVNNRTKKSIDETFLQEVAETVLRGEDVEEKGLSIALVGPKESRKLNKEYRKKDKAANVLSFPWGNDKIPSEARYQTVPGEAEEYMGEIVLCPHEIQKDARKYGMIFERALAWMLIHGVLHLLGFDHSTEKRSSTMEKKEQLYLTGL